MLSEWEPNLWVLVFIIALVVFYGGLWALCAIFDEYCTRINRRDDL